MISLPSGARVWLACGRTDIRKGIVPKQFDQPTTFATKRKQCATEWILRQHLLRQHCQTIDAAGGD
jgi:hypothetical protein